MFYKKEKEEFENYIINNEIKKREIYDKVKKNINWFENYNKKEVDVKDELNAGTWEERFGLKIVKVSVESVELSDESRELINKFASNKMNVKAYEDVSNKASDIGKSRFFSFIFLYFFFFFLNKNH